MGSDKMIVKVERMCDELPATALIMSVLAVSAFTQAVYGFEKCNSKVMMGE
jgi:hypothetical protein